MKKLFLFVLSIHCCCCLISQTIVEYQIKLEPISISDFFGVHSFTLGVSEDEVLIVGGRLDGLHRRQPFASFDSAGHNNQLIVLNLQTKQVWKEDINHLEANLYNQLKATNHNSTQVADSLFVVGGYGINEQTSEHITFPFALKFSVRNVIEAVKNKRTSNAFFVQVKEERLAVTGGQLKQLNERFFLVGGHRFDGAYNPIDRPTFVQKYTNGYIEFDWKDAKPQILNEFKDSTLLHVRDYNLLKIPNGPEDAYLLALSGVFQYGLELPFLEARRISSKGKVFEVRNFKQYYNHYECADLIIYDSISQTANAFLFGGISQYYDSLGTLVQDNSVPFTNAISRLAIFSDSTCFEYLQATKMPALLGSGAQFVQNRNINWRNDYFLWNPNGAETIDLGYIIGGIESTKQNIFWINDEDQSKASSVIYKVSLFQSSELQVKSVYSNAKIQVSCKKEACPVWYNKNRMRYFVYASTPKATNLNFTLSNEQGKVIKTELISLPAGTFRWNQQVPKKEGFYKIEVGIPNVSRSVWRQYLRVEEE